MSMFSSEKFTFNDITSESKNVMLVDMGNVGIEEFDFGLSGSSIIEEKTKRRDRPYHLGLDSSTMSTNFAIVKKDSIPFTSAELEDMYDWLFYDQYKKFISNDDENVYYNVIFTAPKKVLGAKKVIALSFNMRMDAPYGFALEKLDIYSITTSQTVQIDMTESNYKKNYSYLEIEFTTGTGVSDITIKNTDDDGRQVEFTGLDSGETIYINNSRKEIISDVSGNRYGNSNLTWVRLLPNIINNILITGTCNFEFRYSLPILR